MIDTKRKWMIILLFITLKSSDVQFVMPQQIIPQQQPLICPPPSPGYLPPPACVPPFAHAPPVFALPPPQPLVAVVPIAFHIPDQYNGETLTKITTTSSTTTTTTERTIAIAVPLPIPMPIQYAIPAYPPPQYCQTVPIPKGCPPCPPCQCQPTCTPAFFSYCSPCHQKCRCRDRNEIPQPLPPMPPHPVPGPAYPYPVQMGRLPVIMIPYPPRRPRPYPKSDTSSSSGGSSGASCSSGSSDSSSPDSSDSSCQNSDKKKHRKHLRRKMRLRSFKRNFRPAKRDRRDHELVKPVFNYISDNGGVKLRRHISNMDAAELLEGSNSHGRKTKLYTETDDDQISDELKQANHHSRNTGKDINKQINFRNNLEDHIVGQGRKQLIFRPPGGKKISNLTVSFQVN